MIALVYTWNLYLQVDPDYEPAEMETRTVFGLQMTQKHNDAIINKLVFKNVVTSKTDVSADNL